jgi:hypothetical protein
MVVARKSRKQTNQRVLDWDWNWDGADVVKPESDRLAVFMDIQ